ncbi:MAG: PQQ-binding-like beta-propeller repeat protein [Hyphomonadaceae bacterium]
MIPAKLTKLTVTIAAVLLVTACSSLKFGNSEKEAAEAEDKAGRIDMVLGDEAIVADPDLIGIEVALPAPEMNDSWPEAGLRSSKAVGHVVAGEAFEIAWRTDAGEGTSLRSALTSPPIASETAVYVLDTNQTIRAFDINNGQVLWTHKIDSGVRRDQTTIGGGFALSGDTLIVASGYGLVLSFDANTGSENWRRRMDAPMTGAPTLKNDRIYVSSNNNELFALNMADGAVLWSDQAIAETARVLGSPSPAAVEDLVVAPYSSGEVIAYLSTNGRRLWAEALTRSGRFTPISAINDIASRPVLSAGMVFAASQSGVLTAIDGRSGARIWEQPIGSVQAPALAGDYLFVTSVDGQIVCLGGGNGKVFWAKQLQQYENEEKRQDRVSYAGPLIASNRVVLASSQGELIGLSPQTGDVMQTLDLGQAVFLEPIAAGGKIFILTDEARLIAIR